MFKKYYCVILISFCLVLLWIIESIAQPVKFEPSGMSGFQFGDVYIGQSSTSDMALVRSGSSQAIYADSNEGLIVGSVPITASSYMFFEDQLFSIGFKPACPEEQYLSCFVGLVNALNEEYGLTRIANQHEENVFGSHDRWEYLTDSNTLMFASITIADGKVIQSNIRFTDKFLADQMGYANNPDQYKPYEVWVDRDIDLSRTQGAEIKGMP